jgi:hypothetical protein
VSGWTVERVVNFTAADFLIDGLAHFGFHARDGRYYPGTRLISRRPGDSAKPPRRQRP